MRKRLVAGLLLGLSVLQVACVEVATRVEAGALTVGRADVRIPGDSGTRFSFTDDLDAEDGFYGRARLDLRVKDHDRHAVRIEAVPLAVDADGTAPRDIDFDNVTFPAGTRLDGTYRFDSYRVEYRYDVLRRPERVIAVGGTLLVRDAVVELAGGGLSAEDDNLGLVPLLGFAWHERLSGPWWILLDGNALAAPQGRAADVFAGLQYRAGDRLAASFGYRIIEGGADNDDVYTFALFHQLGAAVRWRF
jgi:hypothetical protein